MLQQIRPIQTDLIFHRGRSLSLCWLGHSENCISNLLLPALPLVQLLVVDMLVRHDVAADCGSCQAGGRGSGRGQFVGRGLSHQAVGFVPS